MTAGDRPRAPVAQLGVGVFVSALRDALLADEIDFAVHSYKDLPTARTPRPGHRRRAAARGPPRRARRPRRPDPGRAAAGATSAPARCAASPSCTRSASVARHADPRNVDTRLAQVVTEGDLDAVVLARAGMARLGRVDEITETLDPMLMLPAPAQGALAVECRSDDADLVELLAALDHAPSRAAVLAERALLAALEAGCSAPVAAYAEVAEGDDGAEIYLRGAVISPDGARHPAVAHRTPADAAEIGRRSPPTCSTPAPTP